MRTWITLLAASLLGAGTLPAQGSADLLQIEVAAARRAVSGANIARNMIEVEGGYAAPRAAPGSPSGQARPEPRTQAIREAVTAPSTYRRPYGATLLVLSEPRIDGDVAEITTTLYRQSPNGRRLFETLVLTLRRSGGGWSVQSVEKLAGE